MGITLDIYSHVLPGMQEEAVEKFDKLFEGDVSEKSTDNVSKMLAIAPQNKNGRSENESERCGSRTHDALIKSQVLYH